MKKRKKLVSIVLCTVILVGGAGTAVFMVSQAQSAKPVIAEVQETAVPVELQSPQIGSLSIETEFIGRVQPDESVDILPKMAGTVLATYYNVGDPVKKGDLLFEIDPSDLQVQIAVAQAGYDVAKTGVERAVGSALKTQELQTDSAFQNAKLSYNSARKAYTDYSEDFDPNLDKLEETRDDLYDSMKELETPLRAAQATAEAAKKKYEDYVSLGQSDDTMSVFLFNEYSKAQAAAEKAQAAYASMKGAYEQAKTAYSQTKDGYDVNFDKLKQAVNQANLALNTAEKSEVLLSDEAIPEAKAAAQAQLAQADAQLASAMKQLEYTRITSPIDGVIEQKTIAEHSIATQSSPAFVVSNKDMMVAKFNVPASAAQGMSVGDALNIEHGSNTYTGAVIEVGTMADSSSGLFPVKARIDAREGELLSGVAVKVSAVTAKADNALLIPIDCIYHEDGKSYVYLNVDGKAAKTYVETGITDDNQIEVLSGMSADSRLITSWSPTLLDGVDVKDAAVVAAEQAASAAASSDSSAAASAGQEG